MRSGNWRSLFFQSGDDFLVAAIRPRSDIYKRLPKIRLARWAGGVRIIETEAAPQAIETEAKQAASVRQARRPKPVANNGFSPFEDAMLRAIAGVDDEVFAFLRSLPSTVDVQPRSPSTSMTLTSPSFWLTSGSGRSTTSTPSTGTRSRRSRNWRSRRTSSERSSWRRRTRRS